MQHTDDTDSVQNDVSVRFPAHDELAKPNTARRRTGEIQHGMNGSSS